jgi:electron transfer flavoprotein alpha subunit/NAD-dependent dihydropyrimidine dehydrogenase PreA subunit
MPVTIDLARCDGNGECVKACAFSAIEVRDGKAVVFDNCTDCGACALACGPKAIWSDLFSATAKSALLAVDWSSPSGIASLVDRSARGADAVANWSTIDPSDAGAAADALAAAVTAGGFSVLVLPHAGAGPAIAARTSARLGAHLICGCSDFRIDDGGAVRAVRPRFGGIVNVATRGPAGGTTIVTVYPRGRSPIAAAPLEVAGAEKHPSGRPPDVPIFVARRIVAIGPSLTEEAQRAARGCAEAFGALVFEPTEAAGKQLSPDLYVAFGIDGSTEHNSAFRNSRVVVAVVADARAPISQIADYLLVGDVEEHAKALLAAL